MVDNGAAGDIYTGLEIAKSRGQTVLYATDFTQNRVEMFGGAFNAIGSFTDSSVTSVDPTLGAWSVQAVGDKLYVTFASLSDFDSGVVDVFNTNGQNLTPNHFAANGPGAGPLQNPWGIAQAPANFGAYSNDILIGNVAGAGNINAFDPATGAYLGQLDQPNGSPIAITGLWDLEFGDGTARGGKSNQLFFDAGPNAPGVSGYGLVGVIQPASNQGGNGGGCILIGGSATLLSGVMSTNDLALVATGTAGGNARTEGGGILERGTPTAGGGTASGNDFATENSSSMTGNKVSDHSNNLDSDIFAYGVLDSVFKGDFGNWI
jgi:hypothetical protein